MTRPFPRKKNERESLPGSSLVAAGTHVSSRALSILIAAVLMLATLNSAQVANADELTETPNEATDQAAVLEDDGPIETPNEVIALEAPAPGSISGRIQLPAGYGYGEIYAAAYDSNGWWVAEDSEIGSDGLYSIESLPAGTYKVQFIDGNGVLATQWWNGKYYMDSASTTTVVSGKNTPNINATLVKGGSISGNLTAPSDVSWESVQVQITDLASSELRMGGVDKEGKYVVPGLIPASYKLCFIYPEDDSYSQCWNGKTTSESATPIAVGAAQDVKINANLVKGNPSPVPVVKDAWIQEGGKWYYLDHNGTKVRGWKTVAGVRYYLDANTGVMRTGWLLSGGKWYYLAASGAMQTGWVSVGGVWFHMDSSGAMQTGWLLSGGKWYYLAPSGAMQTGWVSVGGVWFYMDSSGAMQTGWLLSGGKWYYLAPSGAMQTGWVQVGGSWFYMDSSGAMKTGRVLINGKWNTFASNGVWIG